MLRNPALKTVHAATQRFVTSQVRNYSRRALTTLAAFPDLRMETMVQTTTKHGMDVIHDPLLSKGTAFSLSERERLGIRGLVPPRTQEMDKQLQRIIRNLRECRTPLEKFIFMTALQVCSRFCSCSNTLLFSMTLIHARMSMNNDNDSDDD